MRKNGRLRRHDIRFWRNVWGKPGGKENPSPLLHTLSVANVESSKRRTKCPVVIGETCKKEQEEVKSERD